VAVLENATAQPEKIDDVVCYEKLVLQIKQILSETHYDLIESLADMIAEKLMQDKRIAKLRIRLGKPSAISEAENVGIEIERLANSVFK
ncbi:MAG: dihydroneopterin aldolase, partial [Parvibaculales bacterium]